MKKEKVISRTRPPSYDGEFHSLAQINVAHRHCVPFSLLPLGPSGRGQIQNARPQLTPGFFVVKLIHGSWWLSHFGGSFLLNSLDQSSLLAIGSITVSVSWEEVRAGAIVGIVGVLATSEEIVEALEPDSQLPMKLASGETTAFDDGWEGCSVGGRTGGLVFSVGLWLGGVFTWPFGLKNPLSVFCPALQGAVACGVDFERFNGIGGGSLFSVRLRLITFGALESSMAGIGSLATLSLDVAVASRSVAEARSTVVIEEVGFCGDLAGLRVNMSLMLLLLSNSGIKRPDVA